MAAKAGIQTLPSAPGLGIPAYAGIVCTQVFGLGSAAAIVFEAVRLIAPPLTDPLPAKRRGEGARTDVTCGGRRDGILRAFLQNCGLPSPLPASLRGVAG